MGGSKPKASSNWFRSSVEKMKKLVVPVEARLFCVVCKVPRPAGVVVEERVPDSIYRTSYDASVHPDVHVVERVHESIRLCGYGHNRVIVIGRNLRIETRFESTTSRWQGEAVACVSRSIFLFNPACIVLRDFDNLKMMYDVDWRKMHLDIFRHKKKDAYALLYSEDLSHAAENAMKHHFERKISKIVDNYQSYSGITHVEILTIEGTKTNGSHLSCDFVDVHHAEVILSSYNKSHGAGGDTVMVEPHPDEV